MKKCIAFALALSALTAFAAGAGYTSVSAEEAKVGAEKISFETHADFAKFDCYSSFGAGFDIVNGTLYTIRSGEQKAILRAYNLHDFSFSADIVTPVKNAYLDGGIYFGVHGDISGGVDHINAYQICVQRQGGHSIPTEDDPDVAIRLYRFTNTGGGTDYEFLEERVARADSEVSLRVEMRGKTLSVYVSGNGNAALVRTLDDYEGGMVGLRAYYCAMGFDNLQIYGEGIPVNTAALDKLLERAEEEKAGAYTTATLAKLGAAISSAKAAKLYDQYAVDEAEETLNEALEGLTEKRDRAALNAAVERAEALKEADYTCNGWLSLQAALAAARTVQEEEEALSEACVRLERCLADLNRVYREVTA